jgi:hypothetical protein
MSLRQTDGPARRRESAFRRRRASEINTGELADVDAEYFRNIANYAVISPA